MVVRVTAIIKATPRALPLIIIAAVAVVRAARLFAGIPRSLGVLDRFEGIATAAEERQPLRLFSALLRLRLGQREQQRMPLGGACRCRRGRAAAGVKRGEVGVRGVVGPPEEGALVEMRGGRRGCCC